MRARTLLLLVLASGLCGCASTSRVRELADRTGVYVQSLDTGTAEFLAAQNRLNASNQTRLQLLDQRSDFFRIEARQQRFAWVDAGDSRRLSSLDSVTARTPEMVVADLQAKPQQPARVGSTIAEAYGKTTEALADVATKPKPLTVLREFVTFAQAVNEGYTKLRKEAEQSTDKAADQAVAVDGAALASAEESSNPK